MSPSWRENKAGETATTLFLNGLAEREGFEPSVPVLASTTV
jgi:hypothetical protein